MPDQPAATLESPAEFAVAAYQLAAYDFISDAFGVEIEWPMSIGIVDEDAGEDDEW